MSWLSFALLAPATYTVNNFIDKYLLESKVKDFRGMPLYSSIAGTAFGIIIWALNNFAFLSFVDSTLILLTGIFNILALAIYFEVLSKEETSTVIILFQMMPLLNLLLAFFFLGEIVTSTQLLGLILVITAAIGVSVKWQGKKLTFSKSLLYLLLAEILWACSNVLFKFVSEEHPFFLLMSYEGFGFGLGGVLLWLFYPVAKKAFIENFKEVGVKVMSIIFLNEAIYISARLLTYLALSLAPVVLVSIIGSTQAFFGIIFGAILTLLLPKIFKEDITKKNLLKKIAMALIAFGGIYLIIS